MFIASLNTVSNSRVHAMSENIKKLYITYTIKGQLKLSEIQHINYGFEVLFKQHENFVNLCCVSGI